MSAPHSRIERMAQQRALTAVALAHGYAALLVAGPWIFTVLGIAGLSSMGCVTRCGDLPLFRTIVIYNALFSILLTNPLAFFSGRYISDRLYGSQTAGVLFAFAATAGVFALAATVTVVPFYALVPSLSWPLRIAAMQNAMLIGVSWLLIPFAGAARSPLTVLAAFGVNAAAMMAARFLFTGDLAAITLLGLFNLGFAMTDAVLIGLLARRFGNLLSWDAEFFRMPPLKWELPAAGFAYAVGIWVDKAIMWFGAPSGGLVVAGLMRTRPSYDTAMFWAQLAAIPVFAAAFVHIETHLVALNRKFYARLTEHASLRELTAAMHVLRKDVLSSVVVLFASLCVVATVATLLSFVFMHQLGLRPSYMAILRIALWGMVFHTSAMFCFMFLLYFDLRRPALLIVMAFALLNAVLTAASLALGEAYYGYGYMLAAAATFLIALYALMRELRWLHYHAFITNNTSLFSQTTHDPVERIV